MGAAEDGRAGPQALVAGGAGGAGDARPCASLPAPLAGNVPPVCSIRILGPLEVGSSTAPVALGGPKQRSLFAILVLHTNEIVRDRPPDRARLGPAWVHARPRTPSRSTSPSSARRWRPCRRRCRSPRGLPGTCSRSCRRRSTPFASSGWLARGRASSETTERAAGDRGAAGRARALARSPAGRLRLRGVRPSPHPAIARLATGRSGRPGASPARRWPGSATPCGTQRLRSARTAFVNGRRRCGSKPSTRPAATSRR